MKRNKEQIEQIEIEKEKLGEIEMQTENSDRLREVDKEKYPFAVGDAVVVFDTAFTPRRRRDPITEGAWKGIDLKTGYISIAVDGAIKVYPYDTVVEYKRGG